MGDLLPAFGVALFIPPQMLDIFVFITGGVVNLKGKTTRIYHHISGGILEIDGALNKKILIFVGSYEVFRGLDIFPLNLCWDCSDGFSFCDYEWFFNIFHRPFFRGLLLCVIRCGAWNLFWLWLPFNVPSKPIASEELGRKEWLRTWFFRNQGCLPIDLERRWWPVFILSLWCLVKLFLLQLVVWWYK